MFQDMSAYVYCYTCHLPYKGGFCLKNLPDFLPCKGKIGKLGMGKIGRMMVPLKYFLVFDIDHHFNLISYKR